MHHKMLIKIQNWKLALLAILFMGIFTSLGVWQLSRATEKKILLKSFIERSQEAALPAQTIAHAGDWRFHRVELSGRFDNAHSVLLDNKTYNGKIGYEVYTPFKAEGLNSSILVDRGFIPMGPSRKELPALLTITDKIIINGMLNTPPSYVALGEMQDSPTLHWPLRVEYINPNELTGLLQYPLYPYVLQINPSAPAAYEVKWQIVSMQPEKHMGYALQWFAFAATLLILFLALNRPKKNSG
jgi:surfeit locus 1 family protein